MVLRERRIFFQLIGSGALYAADPIFLFIYVACASLRSSFWGRAERRNEMSVTYGYQV